MKKIGEIVLIFLTLLGIPGILDLANSNFYTQYKTPIWIISIIVSVVISISQIKITISPNINKIFRSIKFYVFKTKNIAILLTIQILIILVLIFVNKGIDLNKVLISFGLNILAINLLVLIGKIQNNDATELVLHEVASGRMYLYSNNKLRYIPDPVTFDLLGLSWADTIDVTEKELSTYELLAPITSLNDMKLVEYKGKQYGIVNDKLKYIPDINTKDYILRNRNDNYKFERINTIAGYKIDKPFAKIV